MKNRRSFRKIAWNLVLLQWELLRNGCSNSTLFPSTKNRYWALVVAEPNWWQNHIAEQLG